MSLSLGSPSTATSNTPHITRFQNGVLVTQNDFKNERKQLDGQVLSKQYQQVIEILKVLNISLNQVEKRLNYPSVLSEQAKCILRSILEKLRNLQQMNRIMAEVINLGFYFQKLYPIKNDNQFFMVAMSNQFKVILSLLQNNFQYEQFVQNIHLSSMGKDIFAKMVLLKNYEQTMRVMLREQLYNLKKGNFISEDQYRVLDEMELGELLKQIQLFRKRFIQQWQQVKKSYNLLLDRSKSADLAYNKLSDDLFLLKKTNEAKVNSIEVMRLQQQLEVLKKSNTETNTTRNELEKLKVRLNDAQIKNNKSDVMNNQLIYKLNQTEVFIKSLQLNTSKIHELQQAKLKINKLQIELTRERNCLAEKNRQFIAKEQNFIATFNAEINKNKQIANQFQVINKRFIQTSQTKEKIELKMKKQTQYISYLQNQIAILNRIQQDRKEINMRGEEQVASDQSMWQQKYTELQAKVKEKESSAKMLEQVAGRLSKEVSKLQSQIARLTQEVNNLYKQLQSKNMNSKKLREFITSKQSQISQLNLKIQQTIRITDQNMKLKTIIQEFKYQLKLLTIENTQLKDKLQQIKSQPQRSLIQSRNIDALFQNDILDNRLSYKEYLTQTIQSYMRTTITKTRLIYVYDQLNKVNFHKYIDEKQNIVFIIKMGNGSFIAAYSQGAFRPNMISNNDGLIISLTNNKYFQPAERKKRAISYDDYYIIFGNSEIRIRSLQNKVFSNFGISNSYYNSKKEKVGVLLGGGPQERELQFQYYEVYQLTFRG